MSTDALCEQVVTPPQVSQDAIINPVDPNQARVVRARITTTTTSTSTTTTTAAPSAELVNLDNYYYRPQEGLYGRWYVSIIASGSREGRRVRPKPLQFDLGKTIELTPLLEDGTLEGVVLVSGSSMYLSSQQLKTELEWSKSHNPHRSIVSNGLIPVAPSGSNPQSAERARVGCTLPKLTIDPDGFRKAFDAQDPLLFTAGMSRLSWVYETSSTGLRMNDLVKQLRWTLNANTASVSGSWDYRKLPYTNQDYDGRKGEMLKIIVDTTQPGTAVTEETTQITDGVTPSIVVSGQPLTLSISDRAEFVKQTGELWSQIIDDINDIRVLQGLLPLPQVKVTAWASNPQLTQLGYGFSSGGGASGGFNTGTNSGISGIGITVSTSTTTSTQRRN